MNPDPQGNSAYERCCLCKRITDVKRSEPVQQRKHFVSGVGQLCPDCCWKVYHTTDLRTMDFSD